MNETETVLRHGLAACARATEPSPPPIDDIVARAEGHAGHQIGLDYATPTARGGGRRAPFVRSLAAAVVLLVAGAAAVAGLMGRDSDRTTIAQTPEQVADGPVWPVVAASPEATAIEYLADVAKSDFPLHFIERHGNGATAHYGLMDVEATVELDRDAEGRWSVTGAANQVVRLTSVSSRPGGLLVELGPGDDPRRWPNETVRLAAVAADGSVLDTRLLTEVDAEQPTQLSWDLEGKPVVVRADRVGDLDDDPATLESVIGHAAIRVDNAPEHGTLPPAFSFWRARSLFTTAGDADAVAAAYLRSRFHDVPTSISAEPAVHQGDGGQFGESGWGAVVRWAGNPDGDDHPTGLLLLRNDSGRVLDGVVGQGWSVVAALTDDVDLSDVENDGERVSGSVVTSNINSLAADVLDEVGEPVPGSPRPDGHPGAAHRFATAAGPSEQGPLAIDVPVDGQPAMVRVHLVAGTLLSISELWLEPPGAIGG